MRILILVGMCLCIFLVVNFISKDRYGVITDSQIGNVVAEEKITLLAEERLNHRNKPIALLFYEKDNLIGAYDVTNKNGNIHYLKAITVEKRNEMPIQFIGAQGEFAYVMVSINDKDILKNAEILTVTFGDNVSYSKEVSLQDGNYIIVHENPLKEKRMVQNINIDVYNSSGQVIYRKKVGIYAF